MLKNKGMFRTKCGKCGKELYTYAVNKQGQLPVVYCSKPCEINAKYDKRHT